MMGGSKENGDSSKSRLRVRRVRWSSLHNYLSTLEKDKHMDSSGGQRPPHSQDTSNSDSRSNDSQPHLKRPEMKTSQERRYNNREELPSGFFKIKSKNLDVLVKKDYYAHRSQLYMEKLRQRPSMIDTEENACTDQSSLFFENDVCAIPNGSDSMIFTADATFCDESTWPDQEPNESSDNYNHCVLVSNPCQVDKSKCVPKSSIGECQDTSAPSIIVTNEFSIEDSKMKEKNPDEMEQKVSKEDGGKIAMLDETKLKSEIMVQDDLKESKKDSEAPKKHVINEHASPFYPRGYYPPSNPPFSSMSDENTALYIYTPGAQSMLPCEEIVITSPIIDSNGSALYTSSSNVFIPMDVVMPRQSQYFGSQMTPNGMYPLEQYRVSYLSYPSSQLPINTTSLSGESLSSPPEPDESEINTENSSIISPNSPADLSFYSPENWTKSPVYLHDDFSQVQWFTQPYIQEQLAPEDEFNSNQQLNVYYQSQNKPQARCSEKNVFNKSKSTMEKRSSFRRLTSSDFTNEEGIGSDEMEKKERQQEQKTFIPGLAEYMAGPAPSKISNKKRRKKKSAQAQANFDNHIESKTSIEISNPEVETSSRESNLHDCVSYEEVKKSNSPTSNEGSQNIEENEEDEGKFQKEQSNPDMVIPSKPRRSRGKRSGQKQRQKLHLYANQTAAMQQLEKTKDLVDESQYDEEATVVKASNGQAEVNEKLRNEDENWVTLIRGKKVRALDSNLKVNEDKSMEYILEESYSLKQKLNVDEDISKGKASEYPSSSQSVNLATENEDHFKTSKANKGSIQKKKLLEKTSLKSKSQPTFTKDTTIGAREKSPNLSKSTRVASSTTEKSRQVLVHDGSLNLSDEENSSRNLLRSPMKQTNDTKTVVIKNIGHGMQFGPMSIGRISQTRCHIQNRSADILIQFLKQQHEKTSLEASL